MRRVVVIGGGIGGAAAALNLARAGTKVTLLERGDHLGGLVVSFSVAGTPLECFYHHLIPGELEILKLLDQLGLGERVTWFRSTVAIFREGRVWPFTTPFDLLRFRPLPFLDRIRSGVGAVRLGRIQDWTSLDTVPAIDWLRGLTGERAAEVVWDPLLRAKFGPAASTVPAAWIWSRMHQRAGGRRRGREYLGYLRGGFRQMFAALAAELERLGVDVRTGTAAKRLVVEGGRVEAVELESDVIETDAVLFTGPLPLLAGLVPESLRDPRWSSIGGVGAMCVVLEMTRPATDWYWTNVCDPTLPFGGIIEHTNLVPKEDYGGRHVLYLSRYFLREESIAGVDPDREASRWVDLLEERLPGFSRRNVDAIHAFRTPYAAPLVTLGYSTGIPPTESHIPGLYVSTTAQIYPRDRGMSEGVRMAAVASREILSHGEPAREPA